MIIAGRQMRDFQEIALEIFDTPVTVYGTYEKVLMMAYDPNRTENLEYYQKNQDGYMEEEEKAYSTPVKILLTPSLSEVRLFPAWNCIGLRSYIIIFFAGQLSGQTDY